MLFVSFLPTKKFLFQFYRQNNALKVQRRSKNSNITHLFCWIRDLNAANIKVNMMETIGIYAKNTGLERLSIESKVNLGLPSLPL